MLNSVKCRFFVHFHSSPCARAPRRESKNANASKQTARTSERLKDPRRSIGRQRGEGRRGMSNRVSTFASIIPEECDAVYVVRQSSPQTTLVKKGCKLWQLGSPFAKIWLVRPCYFAPFCGLFFLSFWFVCFRKRDVLQSLYSLVSVSQTHTRLIFQSFLRAHICTTYP